MPYYYDYWYRPARPKTVKGGIKTSGARKPIAENWWGKRWIEVLESFNIGARLSRGRSYARNGQVMDLEIKKGSVKAVVQGTYSDPYQVSIKLQQYNETQWETIIARLGENPIYCAQLVNAAMPDDIENVFASLQLHLFPNKKDDLKTQCSCPDQSNPCKHIAAVYYILAEAFDKNPFLLFELRGMSQTEILEQLQTSDIEHSADLIELQDEPLPLNTDEFWGKELESLDLAAQSITMHAAIPKRLGKISFWRSDKDLLKFMEDAYRKAYAESLKLRERIIKARE